MTDVAKETPCAANAPRWPGWAAAALLLLWYGLTMARDLLWFDTGELALVGYQFGLGHPPGQPLYTVLLGLFARLPGVDPLVGMNLFSALCAAACALPAAAMLRRFVPDLAPVGQLVCLLAVGALAPVWDQASRIELYALASLLSLSILAGASARPTRARAWLLLGAGVGLLAGVNPVFALAAALGAGLYALPTLRREKRLLIAILCAAGAAVVMTLAAYAYVFIVRDAPDRMVWGPLETGADWIAFLTGRDYGHTAHSAWGSVPAHIFEWLLWLAEQGALPVVLLGGVGWAARAETRRAVVLLGLPLMAGVAFTFTYGTYFPQVPDYNGYLMPALWMSVIGLAALVQRSHVGIGVVLLVLTMVTGARPVWDRDRSGIDLPRRLAQRVLDDLPPNALLIVESDHLVFPLMYLQAVEGARPDVVIFNAGFGASSWYWAWQYRLHPELPTISLAAPTTADRLKRFAIAAKRPVFAESVRWAGAMRARPCARGLTFGIGPTCGIGADLPGALDVYRSGGQGDPITTRVIAAELRRRAEGLWLLGEAQAALATIAVGQPEGLPLPALTPVDQPRPLPASQAPILIGSPEFNRVLGAGILHLCGRPAESEAWLLR
ncbi:MAG: hypothetical protein ACI9U2_004085 [Bradymonadia bacterium]